MSILSILEPASASTPRPAIARLATGSIPATVGSDLLVPLADGRVVTRSTPPRRRVAGQQAGASR